jgi:RHS repeat-associated protein
VPGVIARAHHSVLLLLAVLLSALWPTQAKAIHNDATAGMAALRLEEKASVRKIGLGPETGLSIGNQCLGTKAPTRSFGAFGRLIGKWGSMADANRYRFSSKEFDTVTGLYYYGARYYDPTLQRFLNRDPIGEAGGINLYGFCGNNGVCYIDPWGFIWYDDLGNWVQNNVAQSQNFVNNNLPPALAAAADTVLDLGGGLGEYPQTLGHLGEGTGTYSADPSLANLAGVAQDLSTAAGTAAMGMSGLPGAKTPLGKPGAKPCPTVKPASKGSTANPAKGTSLPRNLREQLAAQQAAANPAAGEKVPLTMTDPRWPASDGWQKMQMIINPGGDPINVHYVYNPTTGAADDFKVKLP